MRGPWTRRGGLLVEMLLALVLGVVVFGAFAGALVSALRWTRVLVEWSEGLETVRTVWVVLDEELRAGLAGRDWWVEGERAVVLRAFRGAGRVCGAAGSGEAWGVAFRSRRLPDPGRDSVLVLGADGGWRPFALEAAWPGGPCEGEAGERVGRWRWSQPGVPPPVAVRLFERGRYSLEDGAFRYRRGEGGRQPLTPERVGAESGVSLAEGVLTVTVELRSEPGVPRPPPFEWVVGGAADGEAP